MDSISAAIVNQSIAMSQLNVQVAVSTAMLKQSLDLQSANAAALLQALPQPQPLAVSGSLGTLVNVYA
jgi:hypothetical protein